MTLEVCFLKNNFIVILKTVKFFRNHKYILFSL